MKTLPLPINDYRVILRRFEFDRIMLPRQKIDRLAGGPILSELFPPRYEIGNTGIYEQFSGLSDSFRTLFSIHQFDSSMLNGGLRNFLDSHPLIWFEVRDAFGRIGDWEILDQYDRELESLLGDQVLSEFRMATTSTSELAELRSKYEGFLESLKDSASTDRFNKTYRDRGRNELDQLLREYLSKCDDKLIRICDGNRNLEQAWFRKKLENLLHPYNEWVAFKNRHPNFSYGGNGLAFTPEALQKMGFYESMRNRKASRILKGLADCVQKGRIYPGIMTYAESPTPQITIHLGKTWLGKDAPILIDFTESKSGRQSWKISRWR